MNTIDRIRITRETDKDPDLSFLTDKDRYTGCTEAEAAKYEAEDRKRLREYGTYWHMIGIRAEARIKIPDAPGSNNGTIHTIRSAGLWGIESDSDSDHFDQVAREELAELKRILEQLNVDTSHWPASVAELKTVYK